MKRLSLLLLMSLLAVMQTIACEFKFNIEGASKNAYAVGDEVIVKVTLVLTHRNCDVTLEETKYDYKGFQVAGATQWKEVANGVFERKFKLKVSASDKGKASFSAIRTCRKEGGSGTFQVTVG